MSDKAMATQRDMLKTKSASLKRALSANFDEIKSNSGELMKIGYIVGGVLVGSFILYKILRSSDDYEGATSDKMVVVSSPQESTLIKMIKQSIATFLLSIAKQKLMEYLNNRQHVEEEA
jgi:hypothetical protein